MLNNDVAYFSTLDSDRYIRSAIRRLVQPSAIRSSTPSSRAGTVVRWSAPATTAGLYLSLWNVVADSSELGVFIGAGPVLRWLPHLRWLGWVLLILGPVSPPA